MGTPFNSAYFDKPEALADAVEPLDGTVAGIYITLNPCKPALLAGRTLCFGRRRTLIPGKS